VCPKLYLLHPAGNVTFGH